MSDPQQDRRAFKKKQQQKKMISNLVVVVILLIAGGIGYTKYKNYVPPQQLQARALLKDISEQVDSFKTSDEKDPLAVQIEELQGMGAELKKIPAKFGGEIAKAKVLLEQLDKLKIECDAAYLELSRLASADALLQSVLARIAAGAVTEQDALIELNDVMIRYPDTGAAKTAAARIAAIESALLVGEEAKIVEVKQTVKQLMQDGCYGAAVTALDEFLYFPFKYVEQETIDGLSRLKTTAIETAKNEFGEQGQRIVDRAETGDCNQQLARLVAIYNKADLSALRKQYTEMVARIEQIRTQRLEHARAALASRIEGVKKLEKKRFYTKAAAEYQALLPEITEKELITDIEFRQRSNQLLAGAKQQIIGYVQKAGGIELANFGTVASMSNAAVVIQIDDMTQPLGWDKIRDGEFLMLLKMSSIGQETPELLIAEGVLKGQAGKLDEGDKCFVKALLSDGSVRNSFPAIYAGAASRAAVRLQAAWTKASPPPSPEEEQPVHRGSPKLEPGLKGRKDIEFFCHFESKNWNYEWRAQKPGERAVTVAEDPDNGFEPFQGKALRVRIDEGGHYGASLSFNCKEQMGKEPEEIYFRYYLRFGDDWSPDHGHGGKLPGVGGTYGRAGWGGRPVNGTDGWSARGGFKTRQGAKTPIGHYCYHADMKGDFGSSWTWDKKGLGFLENNRWYCVEQYVKMNTVGVDGEPGLNDGILRGWIDGELAFDKTDLRFRDVDTLKIEKIWVNFYYGGKIPSVTEMHAYVDNVVIARNYIGPMAIKAQGRGKPRSYYRKASQLLEDAHTAELWGLDTLAKKFYTKLALDFKDTPGGKEALTKVTLPEE